MSDVGGPVSSTEIAMFRAAAMKDSGHADERVRVAAVGMLRFLDSHEYWRLEAERLARELEERRG